MRRLLTGRAAARPRCQAQRWPTAPVATARGFGSGSSSGGSASAATTSSLRPKKDGKGLDAPPSKTAVGGLVWVAVGCAGAMGLAMGYVFGTAAKRRFEAAPARAELQRLLSAAAEGDAEAACTLGVAYATAQHGVHAQDLAKSLAYFEQAAAGGSTEAQCRLGAAYRSGLAAAALGSDDADEAEHKAKARQHFELAAAAGHAEAQFNLAVYCEADAGSEGLSRALQLYGERAFPCKIQVYHTPRARTVYS